MKIVYLLLFFIQLLINACSQINTESRDYYGQKKEHNFHHGFRPNYTEGKIVELKSQDEIFDATAAKRGETLYQNHCMKCHGQDGQGNGPLAKMFRNRPLNLAQAVKLNPNFKFFINLSKNTSNMPGWSEKDFSEKDISDLAHYLQTFALK